VEALKAAGFGDDELQIYDHRALVIAYQAAQYRKSQVARAAAHKSVQQKATKAPVVRPGNGGNQQPSALNKASSRLAKSGSVHDAAEIFKHFL
jgi:hypothetical protein